MSTRRDEGGLVLIAVVIAIMAAIAGFARMSRPDCPAGAEARFTRSGWYCVVPPVQP